jgi:signal transduction histidine kinase
MKKPLRLRLFLWLVVLLLLFVGMQTIIYGIIEFNVWQAHKEEEELGEQLMEVVHGVFWDLAALPFLIALAWWISRRMVEPIRAVSQAADIISAGHFNERIQTDRMPDDEMRHMALAVNSAFAQYSDAVERLRRFTGDASHQLRTPLAVIRSIGEVTLSRDRPPEEYRQALGNILDEAHRLTKVTDQLLQLARLERTEVTGSFGRTDLCQVIRRTAAIFQTLCEDKGVALRVEAVGAQEVLGNETLLVEMLANLLDNALRVTPAGGDILVKVETEGGGERLLTVADTGPGIPTEFAERLFELFAQIPGSQSAGAGLGLAIVSAIARVHGGKAELNRRHTYGAVFNIRLPGAPEP